MESTTEMLVKKRNGKLETIAFDKILKRIKKLGAESDIQLNYSSLAMKVIDQLHDGIETSKIDELTAEQCASLSTIHYNYSTLAARIVISNHQKNTSGSFVDVMSKLYHFTEHDGSQKPLISTEVWNFVSFYQTELEHMIDYSRDFLIDYFGFKTLERSYLFRINNLIVERIQHMWLRVAVGIHYNTLSMEEALQNIKDTYDLMSTKFYTHATPTLFNAGTPRPQLSSCFLIAMEEDSLDGIYNTLKDTALISKWAGGIGLHIHNIRAKGSHIHGTNGSANGIVPMLRVFNNTARYVDQGGGKRNGSFAIYLEPWHPDIEDFLEMKKNQGDEELKGRDLFYALWLNDLFMERISTNAKWSLFCPHECPLLSETHGSEFTKLYLQYEQSNKARKVINARSLWLKILDTQMETGVPYLLFKDAANKKSNQQNLGTIKSSNLCCEIIEYSDKNETAVCNLASIALPSFVNEKGVFDYTLLHRVAKIVTANLNKVIDNNYYPTEKTRRSNLRHRPIGIGVQGLADAFIKMNVAFTSDDAKLINTQIFETIYHAALEKSNELAIERYKMVYDLLESKKSRFHLLELSNEFEINPQNLSDPSLSYCGAYSSFMGSPASKGILQFDMWNVTPSSRYDWATLKSAIKSYGIRNSLLIAPMPTASTSQILGFNECFEPFTSNIYTRRTSAGEFIVVNKYLMKELIDLNLWNEDIKNNIVANKGSVQQLIHLPEHIRNKYKIVWEIPMKHLIDMSADRGAFICQSQSLNLWMEDPNYSSLTSMHFYSWKKGLKTGIYYLRRKAKHQAQQFTIEPENKLNVESEICDMCSA
jgi:ribonucleoside-diphosphate reductase alpha chain